MLKEPKATEFHLEFKDLEITTCRGSGAGGQHRNVTDSAVQIKHKPSGITVRAENERSQHSNKEIALGLLRAKLLNQKSAQAKTEHNLKRKQQVGSGMRGDKIRTVALQRGTVTDHRTGNSIPSKKYLRGEFTGLTRE